MKSNDTEQRREFEELVTRYEEPLFRFAFFRLGSRMDAEDVVQEAFLKYFSRSGGPVGHPQAYLFRMVSNGCANLRRRHPAPEPLEGRPLRIPAEEEGEREEEQEAREEALLIGSLLEKLPPEQAETIRLRTWASLRFTEIAEVLDCPVTTVKSRFSCGIEKLKRLLNPQKPKRQ